MSKFLNISDDFASKVYTLLLKEMELDEIEKLPPIIYDCETSNFPEKDSYSTRPCYLTYNFSDYYEKSSQLSKMGDDFLSQTLDLFFDNQENNILDFLGVYQKLEKGTKIIVYRKKIREYIQHCLYSVKKDSSARSEYLMLVNNFADNLGLPFRDTVVQDILEYHLTLIVLIHEIAHAASHLGGYQGRNWKHYWSAARERIIIEHIAQVYTLLFLKKQQLFLLENSMYSENNNCGINLNYSKFVNFAFLSFAHSQPIVYQTFGLDSHFLKQKTAFVYASEYVHDLYDTLNSLKLVRGDNGLAEVFLVKWSNAKNYFKKHSGHLNFLSTTIKNHLNELCFMEDFYSENIPINYGASDLTDIKNISFKINSRGPNREEFLALKRIMITRISELSRNDYSLSQLVDCLNNVLAKHIGMFSVELFGVIPLKKDQGVLNIINSYNSPQTNVINIDFSNLLFKCSSFLFINSTDKTGLTLNLLFIKNSELAQYVYSSNDVLSLPWGSSTELNEKISEILENEILRRISL